MIEPAKEMVMSAIEKNDTFMVRSLVRTKIPVTSDMLAAAIQKKNRLMIDSLLTYGAKVTPEMLSIAIKTGSPSIVSYLLEKDDDINVIEVIKYFDPTSLDGVIKDNYKAMDYALHGKLALIEKGGPS